MGHEEYASLVSTRNSFPNSSAGKESVCNAGDPGSVPDLGRSPEEGIGYPLQYSGLENSMNCIVHGITKSRTQLNNFHFYFTKKLNQDHVLGSGRVGIPT